MQTLANQFFAFGVTVFVGLLLGGLFDVYRVARGLIRPQKIITHVGDLLFWLFSALVIFLFLLLGNWGEMRFYVFLGALLGNYLYFKLLSKITIKALLIVIKVLRTIKLEIVKLVLFLYTVISYPFRLMKKVVLIPAGKISNLGKVLKLRLKRAIRLVMSSFKKKSPPPTDE